ncbi:MAG: flagellar motor switch protein FliN [Gemmatimonadetes bacterium]|jgi:flagellar motor switch protein FliN|nr:flagellar motor switch protein FliN [Gemmatimonadota bacterium]
MSTDAQQTPAADNLDVLQEVDLNFSFLLGGTTMTMDQLTELGEQSLVELDRNVGEPIDVLVNGRLFARGEVVTVEESFGVRLIEIVRPLAQEKNADDS